MFSSGFVQKRFCKTNHVFFGVGAKSFWKTNHVFLGILLTSFITVPVGTPFDLSKAALFATELGGTVFEVALQFSAPILLVVFMVDFGFGMLSRVAPQVNVFQLGFQIKPTVSLFIFLAIIPGLGNALLRIVYQVMDKMLNVLYLLQLKG